MAQYRNGKTSGLSRDIARAGLWRLNEAVKAKVGQGDWVKPRHWSRLEDDLDAAVAAGDATRTQDSLERYAAAVESWKNGQPTKQEVKNDDWD